MTSRTSLIILIKPEAFKDKKVSLILEELKVWEKYSTYTHIFPKGVDSKIIKLHYNKLVNESFFPEIEESFKTGPLLVRFYILPTRGMGRLREWVVNYLRPKLNASPCKTYIHCSDSIRHSQRESQIWSNYIFPVHERK